MPLPVSREIRLAGDPARRGRRIALGAWALAAVLIGAGVGLFVRRPAGSDGDPLGHLSTVAAAHRVAAAPSRPQPDDNLADVYSHVERGIVLVEAHDGSEATQGIGSGFVIDASGLVATSYHVVREAHSAEVVFHSGERRTVSGYMAVKPDEDLAILKIDDVPGDMVVLDIGYNQLPRKLDPVVAVGHPEKHLFSPFEGRVSRVVHTSELPAASRDFLRYLGPGVDHLWIEHRTGIAAGNSGGPLIDYEGRVLGINTWFNHRLDIGYALHVNHLRSLREHLLPQVAPLEDYCLPDPDAKAWQEAQITATDLEKLYQQCAAGDWNPETSRQYEQLQTLASLITLVKFDDELCDSDVLESDRQKALAKMADEVISRLAGFDWNAFAHVAKVNRYAAQAVDSPRSGVFLFATVDESLRGETGLSGALLKLNGTGRKLLVVTEEDAPELLPGMQCLVVGMTPLDSLSDDAPLTDDGSHVILTKAILPY